MGQIRVGRLQHNISSVQSLSHVRLSATPWTTARQASLSITNSRSLPKPMPIESMVPSNHLIPFCRPLLLLPSIFPSIRVFSNESALPIRWPKYWSGLPFPSPGDLPNPGIEPGSSTSQADALPSEPLGKHSHRKKWSTDTCYNVNEPQKQAAWKKPRHETLLYDSIFMKYSE